MEPSLHVLLKLLGSETLKTASHAYMPVLVLLESILAAVKPVRAPQARPGKRPRPGELETLPEDSEGPVDPAAAGPLDSASPAAGKPLKKGIRPSACPRKRATRPGDGPPHPVTSSCQSAEGTCTKPQPASFAFELYLCPVLIISTHRQRRMPCGFRPSNA